MGWVTRKLIKTPYRHSTCHPFLNTDIGKGLYRQIYLFIPHDKSRNTEVQLQQTQKIIQWTRTASFTEGSPKSLYSSNNRGCWIPRANCLFSPFFSMLLGTRNWWSREIERQKNTKKFQRCEVIKDVKDQRCETEVGKISQKKRGKKAQPWSADWDALFH